MYLPQIHLLKPNPQSDGVRIEGGVKRQCLGYEGGAIMNGISVSIKSPKNSLALVTIARSQQSAIRKRAFARIQPCWHYDSGLPAFTTVRREFRLFISHPFVRTAWLDQDNKSSPFQLQIPARPTSARPGCLNHALVTHPHRRQRQDDELPGLLLQNLLERQEHSKAPGNLWRCLNLAISWLHASLGTRSAGRLNKLHCAWLRLTPYSVTLTSKYILTPPFSSCRISSFQKAASYHVIKQPLTDSFHRLPNMSSHVWIPRWTQMLQQPGTSGVTSK